MRIGVDVSLLAQDDWTGVQNYTYGQLSSLLKKTNHQWILFALCPKENLKKFRSMPIFSLNSVQSRIIPIPARFWGKILNFWQTAQLPPIETFLGKLDVFFSFGWIFLPSIKASKVAIVYDLSPILFPQFHSKDNLKFAVTRLKLIAKKADLVIAISEHSKKDAAQCLGINLNKIITAYPSSLKNFKPIKKQENIKEVLRKYKLKPGYLLTIGSSDPRKNTKQILKAYKLINNKTQLLIIKSSNIKSQYQNELEDLSRNSKNIQIINRVSSQDLPVIYSAAGALIYPSLYEGFGLPVLEAMRCGIPVITSDVSSLSEVGGTAAIYVNPKSIKSISTGIKKTLNMKAKQRQSIINNGYQQAKKFSFNKSTSKIMKAVENLATL